MSNQAIFYMMGITGAIFVLIIFAYIILQKHLNKGDVKRIRQLREGTVASNFSSDIIYQKLYTIFNKIPILKRYLHKTRRKLEIIHIQDEYHTRRQAAHVILKLVIIVFILTIAILVLTKGETLLRVILLFFEAFLVETFMTGMIDKLDTKLLKQQIDFFAEIRHAYHEYNMVEEAIYETSQNDELEVSRQGEKIYEILISDDPETELEKYYDIAPNSYLKEFAGISYLTKEFGDRTVDGASLYLKNLNNITEEMQLEILKRDKLDYVFQSLSIISMIPVLGITPLKNWAVGNFSFTQSFYDGKAGLIVQILLIVLTFICYILTRKLKDTGSVRDEYVDQEKVWQMRLYKKPTVKKVVDMFLPKKDSIETRKITKMLKEAAAKQKIETLYVNKLLICIATFFLSFIFFILAHKVAVDYVYTQPTTDYSVMQELEGKELEAAQELTEMDNQVINYFKGKTGVTIEDIEAYIIDMDYYANAKEKEIATATVRIEEKLKVVNKENFKWYELLIAVIVAWAGYCSPIWMLKFQTILRKLEMENEVMEFQTIITMLMKIERVNVEIILEWIERYSNIFREPITKCVNNYEAGAWEALEELKNDIAFPQLIRLVESLQAAVEKIPIVEAFDELDSERDYYQEKRKDANERLIKRKGMIGKVVGFAPMVCLFVGYLIVPLVAIGLTSMTTTFSQMSTMM